jgi:hypothetical protein
MIGGVSRSAVAARLTRHPSRVWTIILGVVVVVFVGFHRFNTLGGALGGFDDDHFVPFAYAKQVQAGDQPLRDFTGLGLQGAWPSLTFDLSAAAQALLGDNLRSEALLAVTGLAAAALLTLIAGSYVAPLPVAFAATVLGTLLATRLYNYPKVLVLAAAVVLIARHARQPGWRSVVALGALTAAAFLFRHDYAVYVASGVAAIVIVTAGSIGTTVRHLVVYAAVTAVLLIPSTVFVQMHGGLLAYIRDSRVAAEQEARRTERIDLGFVSHSENGQRLGALTFLSEEQNAVQWLYYVHFGVPIAVLGIVWWRRDTLTADVRHALTAWAVMALVVAPLFLRGNTGARFGDMVPLTAALAAGVCAIEFRRHGSALLQASRVVIMVVIIGASMQSVWAVGNVMHELDVSGWLYSPQAVVSQAARRWTELGALPNAYWQGTPDSPSIAAVQYLHACTRSLDRVLVISYQPELLPLADRRFAAGRASLIPGLLTDDDHQRQMVDTWNGQSVPIVLVEPAEEHVHEIPIVYKHLIERYVDRGPMPVNGGLALHIYADRTRTPTGVYGPQSWPCFG